MRGVDLNELCRALKSRDCTHSTALYHLLAQAKSSSVNDSVVVSREPRSFIPH